MEMKYKTYIYRYKYIIVMLLILLKLVLNKNEISLVINRTIKTNIINDRYFSDISEVLVNGLSGNISNYAQFFKGQMNNITIKFKNYLNTCEQMFNWLDNIIYVDTSNLFSSNVKSMFKMFQGCRSLKSVNLDNFDTSSVTNMGYLFEYCGGFTTLNVGNFDTSSVKYMNNMFRDCYSLTTLNLSNFNTSSVIDMRDMFCGCNRIKSLDLNHFDTSSVTDMSSMFVNGFELISLKIDNFDTSSVNTMKYMFYKCYVLISLNFTNFDTSLVQNTYQMFNYVNEELKYCIDEKKTYAFMDLIEKFEKNCSGICTTYNSKKYIIEENKCIDNCIEDKKYKYEYNDICYEKCPNNTVLITNSNYLCKYIDIEINDSNEAIDIIDETYTTDNIDTTINSDTTIKIVQTDIIIQADIYNETYIIDEGKIPVASVAVLINETDTNVKTHITTEAKADSTNQTDESFQINENNKTEEIEEHNSDIYKKKNNFWLIILIICLVIILIGIIILVKFICCRKKNIEIIFNYNGHKHRVKIESEENIKYAIDQYNRTNGNNSENHKMFCLNGDNINTEENRDKKVKEFIINGMNILNISVYSGEGNS